MKPFDSAQGRREVNAWTRDVRHVLAPLHLEPARDAEIAQELAQHLQDRYTELRHAGASDRTARREALGELDDRDLVRALTGVERPAVEPLAIGSASRGGLVNGLWRDIRFGARLIVKDRGASLVIVVTLALAIASNAVVFGFTDLLLLRPLPIGNTARLVMIYGVDQRQGNNRARLSIPDFRDIKAQAASLEDVAAMWGGQMSMTGAGDPLAVTVNFTSANLLRVWDVATIRGRGFLPGDDAAGAPGVAVLSHRFWATRFGGDETILGRALMLNGRTHTVVGVLTPAIELGNMARIDMWVPFDTSDPAARRDGRGTTVTGLLKPGATLESVNAELSTIADRLQREFPASNAGWRLRAISMREATVGASTWILLALLGIMVALVLLVACANVATVMLSRGSARRREIAVRVALGATRARLARQLVSEGLLLGLCGGLVGLVLAYFALHGFARLADESFFRRLEVNANLLMFTFALALISPVLFGVLPALQSSRPDLTEDLKEGGRAGASARGARSRSVLVIAQVAFALSLLIVAGLVVRSVTKLQNVPLGINPHGIVATRIRLDPPKYVDVGARLRAVDRMLERVRALPGVAAAAATAALPVVDSEPMRQFVIVGSPTPSGAQMPWAVEATTTGDYRQAFDLPLVAGRSFTNADASDSMPVAIVSRDAARRYWSARSPLGERIQMLDAAGRPSGDAIEIVGVADDVKGTTLSEPPPPRVYRPLAQVPSESVALAVRVNGDPAAFTESIRETLRGMDRDLAIAEVETMDVLVRGVLRNTQMILTLFSGFAGVALLLALTGVYGVTSFSVGQRRHEIGVRVALGASATRVARMIMASSLKLIAAGAVLGIVGGWTIALLMDSVLFGVSATDPATYLLVLALLGVTAAVASFVPAQRAMSIDPVSVLKRE